MKVSTARSLILGLVVLVMAMPTGVSPVLAQAPSGPGAAQSAPAGGSAAPLIVFGLALLVGIVLIVRIVDRQRARAEEATGLEARLADLLLADARFAGASVTAVAHVPFRRASSPTIEVRGDVPAPELREAALRIVAAEAHRLRPDARVDDRLVVLPPIRRQVA